MDQKHISIIGASSAGLFAGYLLARAKRPVRIYESAETLDPTPRTLIVTGEISRVLGFAPEEAVINRIHRIDLFSRNTWARISLAEPDLVIERERLIRLLMQRARKAGAQIFPGHRFLNLDRDGNGSVLRLANLPRERVEEVKPGIVIGADGALSHVARQLPQPDHRNGQNAVSILQARVFMPPGTRADTVQVWFERGDTRFFYWLIPESPVHAAVGLVAESPQEAYQKLTHFLSQRKLEALEYQAARVPFHTFRASASARLNSIGIANQTDADVFLVGDAARQVKVTTAGGVVAGLRGARAVARAILQEAEHRREWRGLKRELDLHLLIRGVLDCFSDRDYDQLLRLLKQKTKKILANYNRDSMTRGLWRLLLVQPQWFLLGARTWARWWKENRNHRAHRE